MSENKCVLIIDETLSEGVVANIAAILSISVGNSVKGLVGNDIADNVGTIHSGLSQLPIPVLGTTAEHLKDIRQKFIGENRENIRIFDFNNFSQQAHTYDEYISLLQTSNVDKIIYYGIALFGDKKIINKTTKGLTLIGKNKQG